MTTETADTAIVPDPPGCMLRVFRYARGYPASERTLLIHTDQPLGSGGTLTLAGFSGGRYEALSVHLDAATWRKLLSAADPCAWIPQVPQDPNSAHA